MKNKEGLKKCPFCGKKKIELVVSSVRPTFFLECLICGANSGEYKTETKAIQVWNTRVSKEG